MTFRYCHFHAHLRHMTITLCNSHPFTFYLPFHTSLRADQCPIQSHVPSTCTLGLDPCARHSLFGRTDPYYIDNFYSSCGLKRLAATLASPLLCNCTVLPVPLSTGPYLGTRIHALVHVYTYMIHAHIESPHPRSVTLDQ